MTKDTAIERASETGSSVLERVVLEGNLAELSSADRVAYYLELCRSLGLNVASRPFEYVTFQGKLVLYARKDATEQLRRLHKVSIVDVRSEHLGDLYVVTVKAQTPDGRTDVDQGILPVAGLRGEALSNQLMKCLTKAKRRVTLSLCGLALPDETEIASIPGARAVRVDEETGEILEPPAALPPQSKAALPPAAPAPDPRRAEQSARWKALVARARELGVDVEPFRPAGDLPAEEVQSLLDALDAVLVAEAGKREEVAA